VVLRSRSGTSTTRRKLRKEIALNGKSQHGNPEIELYE
jgi:hypothetical protein